MNEVYHAEKALVMCLKIARCFETDNLNIYILAILPNFCLIGKCRQLQRDRPENN